VIKRFSQKLRHRPAETQICFHYRRITAFQVHMGFFAIETAHTSDSISGLAAICIRTDRLYSSSVSGPKTQRIETVEGLLTSCCMLTTEFLTQKRRHNSMHIHLRSLVNAFLCILLRTFFVQPIEIGSLFYFILRGSVVGDNRRFAEGPYRLLSKRLSDIRSLLLGPF
jgi:hypothetical protein